MDKSNVPVDLLVDDAAHNCEAFGLDRSILVTRPHNARIVGAGFRRIEQLRDLPTLLAEILKPSL